MKRKIDVSLFIDDNLSFNLEHLIEALNNSLVGNSYALNNGTYTFLEAEPIDLCQLGSWGVLIKEIGE